MSTVPYKVTISLTTAGNTTAKDPNGKSIVPASGDAASVIQAGINNIKSHGTGGILHIKSGVYLCGSPINISGINDLTIEGEGKQNTILRVAVAGFNLIVKSASTLTKNTIIRNLGLDGNNISKKLVDFGNCLNLQVDNVLFERHNNPVPSAYMVNLGRGSIIQNCVIRNNVNVGDAMAVTGTGVKILNNEFYGKSARITSGTMQDCEFAGNYFHDVLGYAGISLENYGSFKNITIRNNRFEKIEKNAILTLGYASSDGGFDTISIHDNVFRDIGGAAVKMNAFSDQINQITYNASIYNNSITNTHYNGIYAGPLKNAKISQNTITTTTGYGIRLFRGSEFITMDGNIITGAQNGKYYFVGCSNVYVNGS